MEDLRQVKGRQGIFRPRRLPHFNLLPRLNPSRFLLDGMLSENPCMKCERCFLADSRTLFAFEMLNRTFSAASTSKSDPTCIEPLQPARWAPASLLKSSRHNFRCNSKCMWDVSWANKFSRLRQGQICRTYPTPETEKERSSVDYPQVVPKTVSLYSVHVNYIVAC